MSAFALVYQGGHHDVWCNGSEHIWLIGGGYCHPPIADPERELATRHKTRGDRRGKCDCHRYRSAQ